MKLEWIKSSGKEDIYGIYIDRGGTKYPLATIEFAPALGRDDLEQLFRAAPGLLEACKELVDLMDGIIDGTYTPDSFTTQPARAAIAKAAGEQ